MKKIFSFLFAVLFAGTMAADVIFPAGTVITFDGTAYNGGYNCNLYAFGTSDFTHPYGNDWCDKMTVAEHYTLTSDFNATTTWLFKNSNVGWDGTNCAPEDNTYTIFTLKADGTGEWSKPTSAPSVTLTASAGYVTPGTQITLTATASNFSAEPTLTYQVKTQSGYTDLPGNTFNASREATYTFRVLAVNGEETAEATTQVTAAYKTVMLKGSMNGWADGYSFTTEDHETFTTTITLAQAVYDFKMVENFANNATWMGNNGQMESDNCTGWVFDGAAGNCKINASKAGDYTFTYVLSEHKLSVTYPADEVETYTISTYYIAGDFTDWGTNKILLNLEDQSSNTITLTAGDHQFKIVEISQAYREDNDEPFGDATETWYSNSGTMTRENSTGWVFESTVDANCGLTADEDGTYILNLDDETMTVSLTFPSPSTALVELNAAKATKALLNGRLIIRKGDKVYDAKGMML